MLVLLVDSNKDMFHPNPTLKKPRKHPLSVYLFFSCDNFDTKK